MFNHQRTYCRCIILFLLLQFSTWGIQAQCLRTDKKAIDLESVSEKVSVAVPALWQLARYHSIVNGNPEKADSAAQGAIQLAENNRNKDLQIQSYIEYSLYCSENHISMAENYLQKSFLMASKKLKEEKLFYVRLHQGLLEARRREFNDALAILSDARNMINGSRTRDYYWHVANGDVHQGSNEVYAALQNYNYALAFATEMNNDNLMYSAYVKLIEFALVHKLYNKAKTYLIKAELLIQGNTCFGDYERLHLESLQQEVMSFNDPNELVKPGLEHIAKVREKGFTVLENMAYSNLRNSFIQNKKFDNLCSLYCSPNHAYKLQDLKKDQANLFFRIQAMIAEGQNQMDSARTYWQQAEAALDTNLGSTYFANFYLVMGGFFERQANLPLVAACYRKALNYANAARYLPMQMDASKGLERTLFAQGNTTEAYAVLKQHAAFIQQSNEEMQSEKISNLDIQFENILREKEEISAQEAESKSTLFQLSGIALFVVVLIAVLIWISRKNISLTVLRWYGYFAFIVLFEFFIFLCHTLFHQWTHQPAILVTLNVALMAILLPLHHAVEHRVIEYLIKKNRIEKNPVSLLTLAKHAIQGYKKFVTISKPHD
jgi:hypothetical protein